MRLAREHQRAEHARMESEYLALSPLQQAIIDCMLEQGPKYQPYDTDSVRRYRKSIKREITKTQIQAAIRNLRQRSPPLIWKSARGEYAIEDAAMHAWFEEKRRKGAWPPGPPKDSPL